MKITFAPLKRPQSGALAVLTAGKPTLSGFAANLDKTVKGALSRALKASRFEGKSGQILDVMAPQGVKLNRILIAGIGKLGEVDRLACEQLGGHLMSKLLISGEASLAIAVDGLDKAKINAPEIAAAIAAGARLRSYRFDKYRTREEKNKKPSLNSLTILSQAHNEARKIYAGEDKVIDGVFLTRDLVSEPPNVLYPKSFATRLKALAKLNVKVEILGAAAMKKLGMGALLGVAQGSDQEPQCVIMRYDGGKKTEKPIAFVGKGVTFDTGGISLKPPAGMEQMKWDMGGAGAVSGVMHALAARKAKVNVVGIVGLVENMPSGKAQRPSDVVTTMSGQTVEVLNTDAEGRLVLADALTYVQRKHKPQVIVDLATLTGAIIISLGHEHGGIFSNNDKLAEQLLAAGQSSGDKLWRMPLGKAYDKLIDTPTADIKNVGPREAGSITAAQFLLRFVENETPWAHLDIAGMVWDEKDKPLWEKGATGYGVRLLDRFVAESFES